MSARDRAFLSMRRIAKRFAGQTALDQVSVDMPVHVIFPTLRRNSAWL